MLIVIGISVVALTISTGSISRGASEDDAVFSSIQNKAQTNLYLLILFISLLLIFISSLVYTLNRQYKVIVRSIETQLDSLEIAHDNLEESESLVEKLKLLDDKKNDFISTINHELRTPLTSIIGYVSILRENIDSSINAQGEQILNVIERNSSDLLNLVEEILSHSNLESTPAELVKTEVDVQTIITECLLALTPQAEASDIAFIMGVEENIDTVIDANENQISQALSNILSNAIKFSKSQTKVQVKISERYDEKSNRVIRISIKDQGIGSSFTLELPAHISELQKMINERKGGVLERAITAIETCAYADLGDTCHEMIGALGFYELGALSDEIEHFSDWLKTNEVPDENEIFSRRVELLGKLKSHVAAVENLGGELK